MRRACFCANPPPPPPARENTNYTAAFNLSADPWSMDNLAAPGPNAWPPAMLAQLSNELWDLALCSFEECP